MAEVKIKILMMDDDEDVCVLSRRMGRKIDATVETAADDREAVAAFTRAAEDGEPFDVVVLDVTIPGRPGGPEVLRQLRDINPTIPSVVTSGYSAGGGVLTHFATFGFNAALAKPFDHEQLWRAVQTAITQAGQGPMS